MPGSSASSAFLNLLARSGRRMPNFTVAATGADAMLNTRRQPRESVLAWGIVSSMNCPGVNRTGAAGSNSNSQLVGASCRLPT